MFNSGPLDPFRCCEKLQRKRGVVDGDGDGDGNRNLDIDGNGMCVAVA